MPDTRSPLLARDRIDDPDRRSDTSGDAVSTTDYGSGVYRYPVYLQPGQFTSLEKLMFFVSSILFILLCVFTGLYARSSYDDSPKLPPALPVPQPPLPPIDNHTEIICLEPHCILSAASILQDVNPDLDPCDDFYAYTCSNWIDNHVLPDAKSKVSVESLAKDRIKQRLNQILSHSNPLEKSLSSSSSLPRPDRIVDSQIFTKLTDFYGACMDEDTLDKRGIKPLYDQFRHIQGLLPASYLKQATLDPPFVQSLTEAMSHLGKQHIWALFEIRLVFQKDTTGEFGWKSWSPVATARRILEFEKKLAQAKYHDDTIAVGTNRDGLNNGIIYERWSLEKLHATAPNVNWTLYVESMLPRGVPMPDDVLVPLPRFITSLSEDVLGSTNSRTLQTYLVWRTLWKYLDTLGEEFLAPRRKLEAKLNGVEARAKPERWETCLSHVDSSIGFLMGRYFVLSSLDSTSKTEAEGLASTIVTAFVDSLQGLSWVDDKTRKEMISKVQSMNYQLGYPSSFPDTQSAISLAEFYSSVNVKKDDFFGNVQSANEWAVKRQWAQLGKPVHNGVWDVNPQDVDATYSRKKNKHGFDLTGRQYNKEGALGQWWSNHSMSEFNNRTRCFVQQYSNFTLKGPQEDIHQVDGERTLDSNLADNGGLAEAYSAWNTRFSQGRNNAHLPGLVNWSVEQLFFINFSRMKCSKSTPESDVREV
ncbi:hypothetical protein F4703DRAFT_1727279 [Phycomyces blakesleeanus]